jgi:hypothetical protein
MPGFRRFWVVENSIRRANGIRTVRISSPTASQIA